MNRGPARSTVEGYVRVLYQSNNLISSNPAMFCLRTELDDCDFGLYTERVLQFIVETRNWLTRDVICEQLVANLLRGKTEAIEFIEKGRMYFGDEYPCPSLEGVRTTVQLGSPFIPHD